MGQKSKEREKESGLKQFIDIVGKIYDAFREAEMRMKDTNNTFLEVIKKAGELYGLNVLEEDKYLVVSFHYDEHSCRIKDFFCGSLETF
jgi:hypothetical protein